MLRSGALLGRLLRRTHHGCASVVRPPTPHNEPIQYFAPGSDERAKLQQALAELKSSPPEEMTCFVGGDQIRTGNIRDQVSPHDHAHVIGRYHLADENTIKLAIDTALSARDEWERAPFEQRAGVFLKAADLMGTKYRYKLLASTMLGTAKTATQAEYDCTCELIDFYRFSVKAAEEIYNEQQVLHSHGVWNRLVYRGLEGFFAAISPFNFTALGGNLAGAPALMGNVVLWKNASTALHSSWLVFNILREAGLPDGVINFVPSSGPVFGKMVTSSPDLAGIGFTGSGDTFKYLWKEVGKNIDSYKTFPRLIGECGGKNYHFIHPSADVESAVNGAIRAGYEYGGQKCSALGRQYVPESLWPQIKEGMVEAMKTIKVGPPDEPPTFYSAVIDQNSFNNIKGYIEHAKSNSDLSIVYGGECDDSVGYYVYPTLVETKDPRSKLMVEEIFGPVITTYVYPDDKVEETLKLVNETSPFGLTGAIYSKDSYFLHHAASVLRHSAGNMYFNDKSTGSVVGQQPFGGGRLSGTNDKTGTKVLLQRYVSPLAIKEQFQPLTRWDYPSMAK